MKQLPNKNIDDVFKDKLKYASVAPSEGMWENISANVSQARKERRFWMFFRLTAAAAVLLIFVFTASVFNTVNNENATGLANNSEVDFEPLVAVADNITPLIKEINNNVSSLNNKNIDVKRKNAQSVASVTASDATAYFEELSLVKETGSEKGEEEKIEIPSREMNTAIIAMNKFETPMLSSKPLKTISIDSGETQKNSEIDFGPEVVKLNERDNKPYLRNKFVSPKDEEFNRYYYFEYGQHYERPVKGIRHYIPSNSGDIERGFEKLLGAEEVVSNEDEMVIDNKRS